MAPYVASRSDMVKVHDVPRMKKVFDITGGYLAAIVFHFQYSRASIQPMSHRFTVITKIQMFHPITLA